MTSSAAALVLSAGRAFGGEAEELQARLDALRTRLDQLEQAALAGEGGLAGAPADAVAGGDFPGSFKLPGSDTSVSIRGFVKLDLLLDFDQEVGDSFVFASIRPNGSAAQNRGEAVRLHARQSRLTFETRTPTGYGPLHTYIEGDFLGEGGDQFASNSTSFRIRHAFGELGPVLAGQYWSNFMDTEDRPELLDKQGPVAHVYKRQPQVRYTQRFGNLRASAAVENPQNDFTTSTGLTPSGAIPKPADEPAHDVERMPDLTAKLAYNHSWGHLAVSGVLRRFETDNGGGGDSGLPPSERASALGGGGLFGGTLHLSPLDARFGRDQVGFEGYYGSGLGRYLQRIANNDGAAVKNFGSTSISLASQAQWGGFAWYQHHWTAELRSTAVYSVGENHWAHYAAFATNQSDRIQSVHANLIWSPVRTVNLGAEFILGDREVRRNPLSGLRQTGDAKRLQISMEYFF